MTQQQLRDTVFGLTKKMINLKAYIKGYGPGEFRVMTEDHSPVQNIRNDVMKVLLHNNIVRREAMIYILNVEVSPFTISLDVKLPDK